MKIPAVTRRGLPLVVWMGFMFSASSDAGSSAHTRPLVESLLLRLLPSLAQQLPREVIDRIDFDLRKSAHVTEYAILAILAYIAVQGDRPGFRHRYILFPLVLGIGFAVSDEWHQSFIPTRGAAVADIVMDTLGITLGTLACQWYAQYQRDKHAKRKKAPEIQGPS